MSNPAQNSFREFILAQQTVLTSAIAERLVNIYPFRIELIEQQIQTWLALFDQPHQFIPVVGWDAIHVPPLIQRIIAVYRDQLLKAGIAAITTGVNDSSTALPQLINIIDRTGIQLVQASAERLISQTNRLEQIINETPLSVVEIGADGLIRRWNPSAEKIFGWNASEAIGQHVVQLLVPGIESDQIQQVLELLLSGKVMNSRNLNITKDRRIITCQWYNALLYNHDGSVAGILAQTQDITEEVQREAHLLETEQSLRQSEVLMRSVLDNTSALIHAKDLDGRYILANRGFCQLLNVNQDWLIGKTDNDLLSTDLAEQLREHDRQILAAGRLIEREVEIMPGSSNQVYLESKFPLYDAYGSLLGTCGISTDITARKRAEQERVELQEQIIYTQQSLLRELSTPLIPLADGLVIMPLVGSIDSNRAQQVIEALLQGITEHQASIVILDITGVPVVDTQVAGALLRAAQAVKLLGAKVILTGIRPEIAQTLVGLGLEFSSIITRGSLQSGISYALGRDQLVARVKR